MFFNEDQGDGGAGRTPARKESFLRTARLARDTGATINVTWQGGKLKTTKTARRVLHSFADMLEHLVTRERLDTLRWVTIQNEPNTRAKRNTKTGATPEKVVTPERLDDMYERLDKRLTQKGLRQQIRFMVGDLIRESPDNQRQWFEHMDRNLAGLMDAYSAHIYWNYFNESKFEERLMEVRRFVAALPNTRTKPIFVTEYGVRGHNRPPEPGIFKHGMRGSRSRRQTSPHSSRPGFSSGRCKLGYAGTIKWDCSHGEYDSTYKHKHYVIGPPTAEGWPLYPMYHLLRLFSLTTESGWKVVKLKQPPETTAAARGRQGAGSGADDPRSGQSRCTEERGHGQERQLHDRRAAAKRTFTLALWNRAGGGQLSSEQLSANAEGVAKVTAPRHAVFALTTKAVSL